VPKRKSKRPSEASIRRKSFLHSCESIPSVLITTVINTIPKSYMNINLSEEINPSEEYGKKIEKIATTLRKFLTDARMKFPNMSILEWYEITLVCFKESSNEAMEAIENSETKTWIECKSKFQDSLRDSLEFATKVIKKVKKIRKKREIF